AELRERFPDCLRAHAKPVRDGDRGGRVQCVMVAWHWHDNFFKRGLGARFAVTNDHGESRDAIAKIDAGKPDVGLWILPIGDHPPVLDFSGKLADRGVVETHDRETIKGDIFDKSAEGCLDRLESPEMIEMFWIDIGDDRDFGGKLKESAIAFVGFDHHPIAAAEPRIGSIRVDDPAVDDGRIEFARFEQRRDKGCRGRLAMRPGDGDTMLQPHEFGEHFRAANDGQALLPRGDEFRVIALDRGRDHDDFRRAEMLGVMADMNQSALAPQPQDIGALGSVRALDPVAEIEENLGDAGHAYAANSYEMDGAEFIRQPHEFYPYLLQGHAPD